MRPPSDAPKGTDYLLMLSRGWIVILCATVLSAGVGWLSWQFAKPTYQSTSKVMVATPGAATTFDSFYGLLNSRSRILSYLLLSHSNQVASRTIEQLGLSDTPADLSKRIVVLPSSTPVFDIAVTGDDPDETQAVTEAVTTNLIALSRQMATVDTAATELIQVDSAGPAQRMGSMWSRVGQAAVLGLILSIVAVIGWALLHGRVLGRRQLARVVEDADAQRTS